MPISRRNRRSTSAIAVAGALLAATGAGAEIIKKEDMLRGITTTREECASTPQTVWVNAFGQDYCVHYYISTAGGEGLRPVVFLNGDYFSRVNLKTWQWIPPSRSDNSKVLLAAMDHDINTDDLVRTADAFSKISKTTAIYLARIGVDGTSGNHVYRKTLLELHLMNGALDAIKQLHGFEGFNLAGQSGGSLLVAGLAGMRRDIGCAVAGSGPRGLIETSTSKSPGRTLFDPVESIPSIAKKSALRLMVVTDPADQNIPAKLQTGFVEKLRRAGRDIPQFFVTAVDDTHHGVLAYTELVAAGCILGKSDSEIATAVSTVVKRNAEFNELRRKEIAALAKKAIASAQPLDRRTAPAAGHAGSKSRTPSK
jgi:DNA-binding NarL/FixJ family response regulator